MLCLVQSEDRDIGLHPLMPSRPVPRGWMGEGDQRGANAPFFGVNYFKFMQFSPETKFTRLTLTPKSRFSLDSPPPPPYKKYLKFTHPFFKSLHMGLPSIAKINKALAKSAYPDQNAASKQGLHCFHQIKALKMIPINKTRQPSSDKWTLIQLMKSEYSNGRNWVKVT